MLKHHEESVRNLINYFKDDPGVIAVILGGSVAKGLERPDSDLDAMVVVTVEKYAALSAQKRLVECIFGHCTYDGGYFDVKYLTKKYLEAVAARGSEPSRNAFDKAKCLYGGSPEINELLSKAGMFQTAEKEEKQFSFYCALALTAGYFWNVSADNVYLRTRAATDIVLFGYRLLLQDRETLFPCHKALEATVSRLDKKPDGIVEKGRKLLRDLDDGAKSEFVESILGFISYKPTKDWSEILTRYTDDNELWWYKDRPTLAEW